MAAGLNLKPATMLQKIPNKYMQFFFNLYFLSKFGCRMHK